MIEKPGSKLQRLAFIIFIIDVAITLIAGIMLFVMALKNTNDMATAFLILIFTFIFIVLSILIAYLICLLASAIGEINRRVNVITELQGYDLYLKIKDDPSLQTELKNSYKVASIIEPLIDDE